ncbi:MAG: FAD-dependent oxidoreductase, partial [Coriobacteriales bacterium]
KKHVEHPVACVGALCDVEMMEDIIASGKADVVELARQFSADPDFPKKAKEGRPEDIRHCMRCQSCFSHVLQGEEYSCAINPQIGWSMEQKYPRVPADKKRVIVAGGGIAGMQAAITAKKRGHDVVLIEKTDTLGGVLKCEKDVPFKIHLDEYLNQQARYCKELGVDIRLNTDATPEFCESLEGDALIAALGAKEFVAPIPGIDGANVISAQKLYVEPDKAGKNIVILGGGLVGQELAVYMGMKGFNCTIVEMLPELNAGGNILQQNALGLQYEALGTKIMTSTKALEVTPDGVKVQAPDGEVELKADTVVTAMGMRPRQEEALALRLCTPDFYLVGDALVSKSIREANWNAYQAALDIGMQTVI